MGTEAEEAATWLIDVGLGDIVDSLLDTNSAIINEKLWSSMSHREGFSRSQMDTVKRRVETVRTNVKGRRHQRPDCRDIFRSPQQVSYTHTNILYPIYQLYLKEFYWIIESV